MDVILNILKCPPLADMAEKIQILTDARTEMRQATI